MECQNQGVRYGGGPRHGGIGAWLPTDEVDGVSIDMAAEKSHCTASIKAVDGDFTQFEAQVGKGLCRDAEVGCEVIE